MSLSSLLIVVVGESVDALSLVSNGVDVVCFFLCTMFLAIVFTGCSVCDFFLCTVWYIWSYSSMGRAYLFGCCLLFYFGGDLGYHLISLGFLCLLALCCEFVVISEYLLVLLCLCWGQIC